MKRFRHQQIDQREREREGGGHKKRERKREEGQNKRVRQGERVCENKKVRERSLERPSLVECRK